MRRLLAAVFVILLVAVSVVLTGCTPRTKHTAICVQVNDHTPKAVRVVDDRCPNRMRGYRWLYVPDRYSVPAVGREVNLERGTWKKPKDA